MLTVIDIYYNTCIVIYCHNVIDIYYYIFIVIMLVTFIEILLLLIAPPSLTDGKQTILFKMFYYLFTIKQIYLKRDSLIVYSEKRNQVSLQ